MSSTITCPRCGCVMEYRVEMELGNGVERKVSYYYRCPRCGYRLSDLVITIKRRDGSLTLEILEPLRKIESPKPVTRR